MDSEKDRIRRIMEEMAKGHPTGRKLGWDPKRKRIVEMNEHATSDETIEIGPEDAKHFGPLMEDSR